MKRSGLVIFAGSALCIYAFYLAFVVRFNHFYEFLLIGLVLVLYPLVPTSRMPGRLYGFLYGIFFLGGLIADLLLGLTVANLWYYTYSTVFEYLTLYLLIYPLGGIVMVQTFLILEYMLVQKPGSAFSPRKPVKMFMFFFFGLVVFLVFAETVVDLAFFGFWLYFAVTFTVLFLVNYMSERLSGDSFVRRVAKNPGRYALVVFAAAYTQAFIHEFPNVFAEQWVYQGWPFPVGVFSIPVVVFFLGWFALTVIPVSVYYLVVARAGLRD